VIADLRGAPAIGPYLVVDAVLDAGIKVTFGADFDERELAHTLTQRAFNVPVGSLAPSLVSAALDEFWRATAPK